jgi:hypothetical protein
MQEQVMRIQAIKYTLAAVLMAAAGVPSMSQAQDTDDYERGADDQRADEDDGGDTLGVGTPEDQLPPSQDDNDPTPQAPAPELPESGIVEQAGTGGLVAYGRPGVLELGGAIGFTVGEDLTQLSLTPSIGWFVANNLELSLLLGFNYVEVGPDQTTFFSALVEPSFHLPFSDIVFGFLGLGAGVSVNDSGEAGFALAPRAGLNIMVGRSGILTPAVTYMWSATDVVHSGGQDFVGLSSAVAVNLGWTVMW